MEHEHNDLDAGAEILLEIRDSEKKADEIIADARKQKDEILQEANSNAAKMLESGHIDIAKQNEKKISDFKEKSSLLKEDKLSEGKARSKLLKSKSDKNIAKAADYITKKFEEMM
ncbi:MAG: hypothetical protein AABX00_01565 [Nanoarchaeota archaeon]